MNPPVRRYEAWVMGVMLMGAMMTSATRAATGSPDASDPMREVRVLLDVPFVDTPGHPQRKDRVDLYIPAGDAPAPVLFWIHGGGLFMGDKSVAMNVGLTFARDGWLVVNINHRLSPEVSHPEHVRDAARAFGWVRAQIARHGGDPQRIVIGGHSAGGYLAGLLCTDPRWLAAVGARLADVLGCVPLSGFFHVERLAAERPKSVWGADPARWPDASPASHVRADVPPFRFVHAEDDVPERKATNLDMAAALRDAGAGDVSGIEIPGRDHRSLAALIGTPGDPVTRDLRAWLAARLASGRAAQ